MDPAIIVAIISPVLSGLGVILSRLFFRRKYRSELEAERADTSLATVQAADVVAKAASAIVQPLLERVGELSRELQLVKQEKEQFATELAELKAQVALCREENKLLKIGLPNVHKEVLEGRARESA